MKAHTNLRPSGIDVIGDVYGEFDMLVRLLIVLDYHPLKANPDLPPEHPGAIQCAWRFSSAT